jgi:hypothetical protein
VLAGAVELRNAVFAKCGTELPATATFDHPTIAALATFVATRLAPEQPAGIGSAAAPSFVQQQGDIAAVQRTLQAAVDELLGFEVPPDQPLMEAGLDSIGEPAHASRDAWIKFARCKKHIGR